MSKKSEKSHKADELSTFRVLAKQALSLDVSGGGVQNLSIQGMDCRIVVKAAQSELAKQRELGGSILAIEFWAPTDADLFVVGRIGFELIEDFLSAITVVSGTTFTPCEFVQIARLDDRDELNCEFIQYLPLPLNHWHEQISDSNVKSARKLLAHWDGLDDGHRLRRAARCYRFAAGATDDVSAFQEAYIGLEAMEPPLAKMAGLTPGSEDVDGSCEKCGHKYVRKRTALVGVRAFVHGEVAIENADEQRKSDWKLMNKLRNGLTHGLVDEIDLDEKPSKAFTAAMHYLHHAICACSHSADLTSERYRLARGGVEFVLLGKYTAAKWPALEDWAEILETSSFKWVQHAEHNLVPEIQFRNDGLQDIEVGVGRLKKPLSIATMKDVGRQRVEID